MPPVAPQGSRAGLITAVVIMTILFVTTTILWIYNQAQATRAAEELADVKRTYNEVISTNDLNSPEVMALKTGAQSNPEQRNLSVYQLLVQQRNQLAKRITGVTNPAPPAGEQASAAIGAADAVIAKATGPGAQATGVRLSRDDSLVRAIGVLSDRVNALQNERDRIAGERDAAQAEAKDLLANQTKLLLAKDSERKAIEEQVATLNQERTEKWAASDERLEQIAANAQSELDKSQKVNSALQVQVAERDQTIKSHQEEIDLLRNKLAAIRVPSREPVVRQDDGRITRIPGNGFVYINLGKGDQISPGMTFQVYDKITGIPKLGNAQEAMADENLPVGKAEIEVVRVIGPGSSQARIIKQQPGQQLLEGDLLMNLIYDRNARYNFVVYGDFDLDQDGRTNPNDEAVIQRLVTQWGGKLMEEVNADTDFVVLGREPEVPELTEEEKQNPEDIQRQEEAERARDAYLDLRGKAEKLNIPIMNQNRFLYFVGYYERAQQ